MSQFPPRIRDGFAEVVNSIRMINRGEIRRNVPKLVSKISAGSGARWITNFSPNSGSFVRMLAEQELRSPLKEQGWTFTKSLSEALDKVGDEDNILLLDDTAMSGSQAAAQLLRWVGVPREQWPTELQFETNIDDFSLSPSQQARFRGVRTTLGFVFAGDEAKKRLVDLARSNGLDRLEVIEGDRLEDVQPQLSDDLRDFLRSVGSAVLAYCRKAEFPTQSDDEIRASSERDALGYRSKCCAIVTPFNVPSGSITALWCPGLVGSIPWVPLFIRRGYLKHLILH